MLEAARDFIKAVAESPHAVLLVPDRNTGGISAGTIVSLTLQLLGKPVDKIHVYFVQKGLSIFDPREKADFEQFCQKHGIRDIIVLDQSGRRGTEPPITTSLLPSGSNTPERKILFISNQYSAPIPNITILSSSRFNPPIAPTSLLAYTLCCTLHPTAPDATALPALVGTLGDPSFPDKLLHSPPVSVYLNTDTVLRKHTTKWTKLLISLLNITRRSPLTEGNGATRAAWDLLQFDPHANPADWPTPKKILSGTWGSQQLKDIITRLEALQERYNAEIDKWKRAPPKFSSDGRVAVIEIASPWLIHPLLVGRWLHLLQMKNMQDSSKPRLFAVGIANTKYIQGKVDFTAWRTAHAIATGVDLIPLLNEYADKLPSDTKKRVEDFTKGQKEAPGWSLETGIWEEYRNEGLKLPGRAWRGVAEVAGLGDGKPVMGIQVRIEEKWEKADEEGEGEGEGEGEVTEVKTLLRSETGAAAEARATGVAE